MFKRNNLIILILSLGIFGIMNTEMGVVGILPLIADHYGISVTRAGLLVSVFALVVAVSGPIMPVLFSGFNRKKVMLISLGIFVLGNIVSIFASSFNIVLIARAIPAIFHPVYCSLALTIAAMSGNQEQARKAISTVIMGVSAGMVLGVPITTFIANATSIEMSLTFSAVVNVIAFLATLLFVPSMPVQEKVSHGAQLSVLKRPLTWLAIVTIIFMSAAVSAPNSYLAEYLGEVTHVSGQTLSIMLLLFGVASILGNLLAGKLLSKNAMKTAVFYPITMGVIYVIWYFTGESLVSMVIIMALFGIMFSIQNNINQYWITSAAHEAPELANGLFVSCSNWGISSGTAIGGLLLSGMGIKYILWGGILFLILSLVSILLRSFLYSARRHSVSKVI
ncbi:Predicted arabinose efflux permease, MFS family [Peribacillus simplex]|uniref:Predicted arabinose efflux permease, MFS family n=1 Tax=Peribacillus simplex TaxID=1478 RepID=A0A9X8WMR9_9BACI|nr:MFS transporter [Peribacillus simplex]SIR99862.1 Predicted arabinose efflux permease, MFS family [Peribacillus simplex]